MAAIHWPPQAARRLAVPAAAEHCSGCPASAARTPSSDARLVAVASTRADALFLQPLPERSPGTSRPVPAAHCRSPLRPPTRFRRGAICQNRLAQWPCQIKLDRAGPSPGPRAAYRRRPHRVCLRQLPRALHRAATSPSSLPQLDEGSTEQARRHHRANGITSVTVAADEVPVQAPAAEACAQSGDIPSKWSPSSTRCHPRNNRRAILIECALNLFTEDTRSARLPDDPATRDRPSSKEEAHHEERTAPTPPRCTQTAPRRQALRAPSTSRASHPAAY